MLDEGGQQNVVRSEGGERDITKERGDGDVRVAELDNENGKDASTCLFYTFGASRPALESG